jgi:hypothetical protein
LDEAEQWLGDNDDEEATSRRIRKFLKATTGSADAYVGNPQPLGEVLQRVNDVFEAATDSADSSGTGGNNG